MHIFLVKEDMVLQGEPIIETVYDVLRMDMKREVFT